MPPVAPPLLLQESVVKGASEAVEKAAEAGNTLTREEAEAKLKRLGWSERT